MKSMLALAAVCVVAVLVGCEEKSAPAPAVTPAAPAAAPTRAAEVPEYKPEYAIAIEESTTTPKTYAVNWSAKVNSGGWTMTTDRVLVEEYNGMMACRIWVTLEQPGPGEMTTQALQTVTGKHDAGTTKIERVEFSVRRQVKGVKSDFPATYAVVKSIKYPY